MKTIQEIFIQSPRRPNRALKKLKGIVIHWTANTNQGADAKVPIPEWF